jgi:tetratricopeptide (TPR) repeat protein
MSTAPPPDAGPRNSGRGLAWLALALLMFGFACRSMLQRPIAAPVNEEASAALEEARAWARTPGAQARERARAALERARRAAPEWVAPRRMADIFAVDDLLGIEALAEHRAALARNPRDAVEQYLAGRLEGVRGVERFEAAARLDPGLAWAHHGLGWAASARRQYSLALQHSQRALSLARDNWERTYFISTLARYYALADEPRRAIEVLAERLASPDLAAVDSVELGVQAATIELGLVFQPEYASGWRRALALLRECDLTDAEVEDLVRRMRVLRTSEATALELSLALAARPGRARDRERARILLDQRPSALALGLLNRAARDGGEAPRAGPTLRAARFAAGQFRVAVDEWLADLPSVVRDEHGVPRDARLATVVEAARAWERGPGADALEALGEALLAAGWFREARSVAAVLAADDLDRALLLEDRAAAGQQLLLEWQRVVDAVDRSRRGIRVTWDRGAELEPIESLDDLLGALAPPLAAARSILGSLGDAGKLADELRSSPRLGYGGFAAVVHPGPWYSVADEREGLGAAGELVPGLARCMDELGRFAIFGELSGVGAPDATILSRVHVERTSGEHLGVKFSGTVAWCEGADVPSRAGRLGAEISGAALHEGYWIDIDTVRRERAPWERAAREFVDSAGSQRAQRALQARGLELVTSRERAEQRRFERRDASILLGAADRVRLAVLLDRAERTGEARVSLDEFIEITAVHEEGHLCDRERFLPLQKNWLGALRLLAESGFTPAGVAQRLEYRAQLIALCVAEDPRVPLVAVLGAVDGAGPALTPHASAYRDLLVDLLAELDHAVESEAERWASLDPDRVLVHQLHRLSAEEVREVALRTARRGGLVGR